MQIDFFVGFIAGFISRMTFDLVILKINRAVENIKKNSGGQD